MKVIVNFYVKKRSEKESKYCACTKMDSHVSALEKAPTIHLTVDDFSSKARLSVLLNFLIYII